MSRSLYKGPYFKYANPFRLTSKKHTKLYVSRASMILPSHINKAFEIHNGKKLIKVSVSKSMVGHKFGEFALTKQNKTK